LLRFVNFQVKLINFDGMSETSAVIMSTLRQNRPNKAGLKSPSVRAYVRTST